MFFMVSCGDSKSEKHPNELNYSFEEITEFDKNSSNNKSQLVNLKDRL